MRILLILTVLSALISITHTKTREEYAACLSAQTTAYLKCGTTADTTKCGNCINKCIKPETGKGFEGYIEDCVQKCNCPGVYAGLKIAALSNNCKSNNSVAAAFTGIMLILLMALLI